MAEYKAIHGFTVQNRTADTDPLNIGQVYYRSDTGDMKVTSRSPYVRNVTVITQGQTTSASDPRGFDSGDAGKGALVDGSVCDHDSETHKHN